MKPTEKPNHFWDFGRIQLEPIPVEFLTDLTRTYPIDSGCPPKVMKFPGRPLGMSEPMGPKCNELNRGEEGVCREDLVAPLETCDLRPATHDPFESIQLSLRCAVGGSTGSSSNLGRRGRSVLRALLVQ